MKKRSDPIATFINPTDDWEKWREGILGFGERSSRKTYYAELQRKTDELERFQSLLNKSHDAIFLIASETGVIIDVNETASRLSGYSRPELLCMTVTEILDIRTVRQITHGLCGQPQDAAPHTVTTTLRTNDEQMIPVEISIEYVQFGKTAYVVAVARDITERIVIEQERDRLFKERTLIVEHVPVGLMFLKNRQFIWANAAMERLFGYTPAELQGQTTALLYPSIEDYASQGGVAYAVLAQGNEYTTEGLMQRKDRTLFWCKLHGQAIQPDDLAQGTIWILEDITEHRRLQETQQQLNAELERRVQQRTAELEAMNKELESFAYVVSHDLKAPLRNITQLITWLVDDYSASFDEQGKEYANLLVGRVRRMENLINGVLEYSRIGRIVHTDEPLDINLLLLEVLDTLAPPPQITITLADTFPTIIGDKTRISQIFQNLLGNAMKFMDKPQGIIAIDCRDDGAYWQFSVADNGPGIDAQHYEWIFQIFHTLHPHDDTDSTGIGLAIVKKIIEFYGGNIWVESEVGTGSTFYFTLPKAIFV